LNKTTLEHIISLFKTETEVPHCNGSRSS